MSQKTILLVEDEEVIRRLCGRILSKLDHQLILAENVQQAFETIQNTPVDLLITDLKLPDGHGTDVIRRFREKSPIGNVIIITGSPTPEEGCHDIKGLGVRELIFKPFEPSVLEAAVRKALKGK